jgi:hypothetical protein
MTRRLAGITLGFGLLIQPCGADSFTVTIESQVKTKIEMEAYEDILVGNFLAGLLDEEAEEEAASGSSAAADTADSGGEKEGKKPDRSSRQFYGSLDFANETREYLIEELRAGTALNVVDVDPPELPAGSGEELFEDSEFWAEMAANYRDPLILTGRARVASKDVSGFVQERVRERYNTDRELTVTRFRKRYAYTIVLDLYFIDGAGDQIYSEQLQNEITRSELDDLSPLGVFYSMMDEIMPQITSIVSPPTVVLERHLLE